MRVFPDAVDYAKPDGLHIRIFVHNLIPLDKAKGFGTDAAGFALLCVIPHSFKHCMYDVHLRKLVLYLQGSSGFSIDLSFSIHLGSATLWLDFCEIDLSTPMTVYIFQTKQMDNEAIIKYLKHFRADNIGGYFLKTLRAANVHAKGSQTMIFEQSFGGFCAATYLLFHSDGLKEIFITGDIPPMVDSPGAVDKALVLKVEE
ncbi:uncharacterized protein F5147DRAFT_776261 [Suillus discolor]|uniref:Uncharacterized protein n=1 Tax=Suillus discolor TaxID=1912936 RepID=A0A9P7F1E5_9AGAM|nr:uncharacterized protein F5147DRAFT_776261 [Suillus discolor]KAG2102517.1 hypothetical protein F5147DRAFT_776261 [Suillus discolor]